MQDTVTIDRDKYLGGSDTPAVMGISRFTKRFDLLQYKLGYQENPFKGNIYTEYGQTMEPLIRDYINETCECNFIETKKILDDSDVLPTRYHADGDEQEKQMLLEVKTTSDIKENVNDYQEYLAQLLKGLYTYDYQVGVLAVYERPEDMSTVFDSHRLQVFFIKRSNYEGLLTQILDADALFRGDYAFLEEHPWATEADLPSRNSLAAVTNKSVEIGGLKIPVSVLLQNEKVITDIIKATKAELLAQMTEHKIKTCSFADLGLTATIVPQGKDKTVKKFDEKKFAEEHKKLYERYCEDTIQKGKVAYLRITSMAKGKDA